MRPRRYHVVRLDSYRSHGRPRRNPHVLHAARTGPRSAMTPRGAILRTISDDPLTPGLGVSDPPVRPVCSFVGPTGSRPGVRTVNPRHPYPHSGHVVKSGFREAGVGRKAGGDAKEPRRLPPSSRRGRLPRPRPESQAASRAGRHDGPCRPPTGAVGRDDRRRACGRAGPDRETSVRRAVRDRRSGLPA